MSQDLEESRPWMVATFEHKTDKLVMEGVCDYLNTLSPYQVKMAKIVAGSEHRIFGPSYLVFHPKGYDEAEL